MLDEGRGAPLGAGRLATIFAVCLGLAAATLLVFAPTLRCGFVNFDDDRYVYDNPQVAAGLTAHGTAWAFTHVHSANWHPLTTLSHMLDCQLFGLEHPGGHHFTNVLLHAATSVLLFLLLLTLTGRLWPSALVAALFAWHPLRVESVAWVAERKDVLSGLFFVLTLAAYAGYAARPFRATRYLLLLFVYALGLMTKPMLVSVPLVLLLLDYWPLRRTPGSAAVPPCSTVRWIAEKIPLLLLAAGSCVVTAWVQQDAIAHFVRVALPWRIANALVAYVAYLGKFFWPVNLAVLYPHPETDLPAGEIAAAALLLAVVTALAAAWRCKRPWLPVGWLWYLGMLVPVVGLVQVGPQAMADRYTYLPQIGLSLALVWGAADLTASWPYRPWICGAASAILLSALLVCTWRQTSYWRDSETLWNHTLACTSRNYVAQYNFGRWLANHGRTAEAVEHFRNSIQINRRQPLAYGAWGEMLFRQGRFDEAIQRYQQAVDVGPDYADAHKNLGVVLSRRGSIEAAIEQFQIALRLDPGDPQTQLNLAVAQATVGRLDAAIGHCRTALLIEPRLADAHGCLALALYHQRQWPEAVAQWRETLRLEPRSVAVLQLTAWALATCPDPALRNASEAVELAQRAIRLAGGPQPTLLDTLAAAYAEAGRFSEAVSAAQQALELAWKSNDLSQAAAIRQRLRLYEAGSAFHEPRD
jgi:tetratricopeptide (TPR) repeat protein